MFVDPDAIPYTTRLAWLGAALLLPPSIISCIASRSQEAAPFWTVGASGVLPALFLYGAEDRVINGEVGASIMKEAFGGHVEVVRVEGAGHAFFVEKSWEVNTAIEKFVRKVTTARASVLQFARDRLS
jgi:pimeloyl-ACP methyl ester carboxylesterase